MKSHYEQSNLEILKIIDSVNITSTQLADALDKTGSIPNCYPLCPDKRTVGFIHPVFCANGSNYQLHKEIQLVKENSVCCIFTYNCEELAVIGELICSYLFNQKKIKGLIVHGKIRDLDEIVKAKYPVWISGHSPIGCSNKPAPEFPIELRLEIENKYNKSAVICDRTGVVAIPSWRMKEKENTVESISLIHHKEKIWNYCIETLGWSTYKTICEKSYMKDGFGLDIDKLGNELKLSLNKLRKSISI